MAKHYASEMSRLADTFAWVNEADVGKLRSAVRFAGGMPMRAVGSGGSLTVAHSLAHLHQRLARQLGVAETPLELAELGAAPLSNWLLSAEGSNVDILGAAETLACEEPRQLAILCGRPGSPLADIGSSHEFIDLFLYPPLSGKDGFLATNSLLGFASLLARSYIEEFHNEEEWKAVGSIVEPLLKMDSAETESWSASTRSLWSRHTILVLHDANTRIGAIDLESKFSEAALGNLQVADYRNFAHGRHHWLAKRGDDSSVLALFSPSGADLANRTLALLPKNIPVSRVALPDGPTAGMLGSLVAALKITGWAGHARGIDPGNPGVPEFGRKIYHLPLRRTAKKTMVGLSSSVPESGAVRTAVEVTPTVRLASNPAGQLGPSGDAGIDAAPEGTILAQRSGLDRSYVGGIERGVRNPTIKVIGQIAEGLGMSVAGLFSKRYPER